MSSAAAAIDTSPIKDTLSRSDVYDLYVADRDVRASFGMGFLPPCVAKVFEKYSLIGPDSVDAEVVAAAFSEFQRANEVVV